jgi:hypothetical protein
MTRTTIMDTDATVRSRLARDHRQAAIAAARAAADICCMNRLTGHRGRRVRQPPVQGEALLHQRPHGSFCGGIALWLGDVR